MLDYIEIIFERLMFFSSSSVLVYMTNGNNRLIRGSFTIRKCFFFSSRYYYVSTKLINLCQRTNVLTIYFSSPFFYLFFFFVFLFVRASSLALSTKTIVLNRILSCFFFLSDRSPSIER